MEIRDLELRKYPIEKKYSHIFLLAIHIASSAQFYLRGEVKDEQGTPLANAKIRLHSSGYVYYSEQQEHLVLQHSQKIDSVTIQLDGYNPRTVQIDATKYQFITLKILFPSADIRKNRLLSFTKNLRPEDRENWAVSGETYTSQIENEFVDSRKYPETGFAIHTDKAPTAIFEDF
jgi:Ca-activated chloride channel family protein